VGAELDLDAVANALLGVSQGLTWSTTVIMKIDLAGPARRGSGDGVQRVRRLLRRRRLRALATGWLAARYGLRPEPFYLGVGFVALGLGCRSSRSARPATTSPRGELHGARRARDAQPARGLLAHDLARPRPVERQPGGPRQQPQRRHGVGPVPAVLRRRAPRRLEQIGTLAAIYPATWGVAQLVTGAWSDRVGRKWLIASGMWVQAIGIAVVLAGGFAGFATGAALLGVGTAMVYPTLLAAIGDVAHPSWRASAVGVYRLWRDLGYAIGALLAGLTADALG
jgi:hypothetical protein